MAFSLMLVVKNIFPDVLIRPDWIASELNIVSLRQDINIEAKQADIRVICPLLHTRSEGEREGTYSVAIFRHFQELA